MTTGPPWVLNEPVVTVTRPQPPVTVAILPLGTVIGVPWPRCRVTGAAPPPPPRVRLATPPQGPWRVALPPALRYMLAHPLPARVVEPAD